MEENMTVNKSSWKDKFRNKSFRDYFPIIFLVVMCIVFGMMNKRFFSWNNFTVILVQVVTLLVSGMGATFVIMTGSIDLSVGSVLAFSAVVTALTVPRFGVFAFVFAILAGALCGLVNGIVFAIGRVPSFIATMGSLTALRGVVLILTQGVPIQINDEKFLTVFSGRSFLGIPNTAIFMVIIVIVSYIILEKTPFGKEARAIGGGERVAELAGIKVVKTKVLVYMWAGTMFGIAGLLQSARVLAATATLGEGFELDVIAAVVVGGTPLSGGVGGIGGTILGAFIIQILSNGMNMMGLSPYLQSIVKGCVLVLAVFISIDRTKKAETK